MNGKCEGSGMIPEDENIHWHQHGQEHVTACGWCKRVIPLWRQPLSGVWLMVDHAPQRDDQQPADPSIKYRVVVSIEVEMSLDHHGRYQPNDAYDQAVIALTGESAMWIENHVRVHGEHVYASTDGSYVAKVIRAQPLAVYPAEVADAREVRTRMRADKYKQDRDAAINDLPHRQKVREL